MDLIHRTDMRNVTLDVLTKKVMLDGPDWVWVRRSVGFRKMRGADARELRIPLLAIFVEEQTGRSVGATKRTVTHTEERKSKWDWVLIPQIDGLPKRFTREEWEAWKEEYCPMDRPGDDLDEVLD